MGMFELIFLFHIGLFRGRHFEATQWQPLFKIGKSEHLFEEGERPLMGSVLITSCHCDTPASKAIAMICHSGSLPNERDGQFGSQSSTTLRALDCVSLIEESDLPRDEKITSEAVSRLRSTGLFIATRLCQYLSRERVTIVPFAQAQNRKASN